MEKQIVTFRIDKELHTEFKIQAIRESRTMVTILEELIRGYLKKKQEEGDKEKDEGNV